MTVAELIARVDARAARLGEAFRAKPVYGPMGHRERARRAHVGPMRRVVSLDGDCDRLECGHTVAVRGGSISTRRHCPVCR